MPHFFTFVRDDAGERWQATAVAAEGIMVTINGDSPRFQSPAGAAEVDPAVVLILPVARGGARPGWTLLAGCEAGVWVNGQPLLPGIRVLSDKDEILVNGHRMFFSTEESARVVPFPGLAQEAFCPRCKQKIQPGDPAVCCPQCQAWSHQSEKLPCWLYDETCALCRQQATALDAGFNFNPAKL